MTDDIFREALEILAHLFEFRLGLLHLLAVLVDVEQRDPADAHLEQAFDIGIDKITDQLFAKRLEAIIHGCENGLVGLRLFDFLVDAFLDEDPF